MQFFYNIQILSASHLVFLPESSEDHNLVSVHICVIFSLGLAWELWMLFIRRTNTILRAKWDSLIKSQLLTQLAKILPSSYGMQ